MGIIDTVRQNIGANELQQISQELGTDPAQTQRAIDAALPMMVGGMAGSVQQTNGASALQSAMSVFGSGSGSLTGGILGSILGQHHDTVQTGVEQASGFDSQKAGKLLLLLAPFILRSLAKHQSASAAPAPAGGQPDGGIAGSLQQDARNAQINAGPHVGGVLGKILGALN